MLDNVYAAWYCSNSKKRGEASQRRQVLALSFVVQRNSTLHFNQGHMGWGLTHSHSNDSERQEYLQSEQTSISRTQAQHM